MKKTLLIIAMLALSGCSLLPQSFSAAEQTAATAVVQSSERVICRDIPVGTWLRMYGNSDERMKAWRALCIAPNVSPTQP